MLTDKQQKDTVKAIIEAWRVGGVTPLEAMIICFNLTRNYEHFEAGLKTVTEKYLGFPLSKTIKMKDEGE